MNNFSNVSAIWALLERDIKMEWRQKYALNGIMLQVVSMLFVVFLSLKIMNAPTWNAVFWIILLFSSVNAVAKGFIAESRGLNLYLYGLAPAHSVIIAKLVYNAAMMLFIIFLALGVYLLLMDNMAQNLLWYAGCLIAGGLGFSMVFTMVSAIASKAGNSHTLMSILSFPLIIPLILVSIKASKKAMDGLDTDLIIPDLMVIMAMNLLVGMLAIILFRFLWKD